MKKRRLFPVEKSREALILNVKRNIQENLKITKFHGVDGCKEPEEFDFV